jgi:hypothetical protein
MTTTNTRNRNGKDSDPAAGTALDTDTASYEQLQGSPDVHGGAGKLRYPKLPHERDESAEACPDRLQDEARPPADGQISDAATDVESGRIDTDRRGTPSDVPGRKSS